MRSRSRGCRRCTRASGGPGLSARPDDRANVLLVVPLVRTRIVVRPGGWLRAHGSVISMITKGSILQEVANPSRSRKPAVLGRRGALVAFRRRGRALVLQPHLVILCREPIYLSTGCFTVAGCHDVVGGPR